MFEAKPALMDIDYLPVFVFLEVVPEHSVREVDITEFDSSPD